MEFEYEITAADYAQGYLLFYQLNRKTLPLVALFFAGVCFLVIGLRENGRGISPILLGSIGVLACSLAVQKLFPGEGFLRRHRRRFKSYNAERVRKCRAVLRPDQCEVSGEISSWRIPWSEVSHRGENKHVLILQVRGTLIVFPIRCLEPAALQELRGLAGLSAK